MSTSLKSIIVYYYCVSEVFLIMKEYKTSEINSLSDEWGL